MITGEEFRRKEGTGMKSLKLWVSKTLIIASVMMLYPTNVFAAEHVISSVSIKVYSSLEGGEVLPSIDINSTSAESGGIAVNVSGSKCSIGEAEWVTSTSKEMSVGATPEMRITLYPESDYYFKGSYRSSNVSVSNGTFVSANRRNEDELTVRIKVKGIKGSFEAPENAYWKDNAKGTARWDRPEYNDSGKYEVQLRRGSTTVTTIETNSTSYNFYPYMTTAGTYRFKVRTIAKNSTQSSYGKNSAWEESDEIYIAKEDVAKGNTIPNNNGVNSSGAGFQAGWIQNNGSWLFYLPNGTYIKDTWYKVNDKWYLFDASGKMLTGFQNRNNQTYFLANSGEMATGWQFLNNQYYYFNPTKDSFEGSMFRNMLYTIDGATYYFDANGVRSEGWREWNGNWYYFYPGNGQMARNTMIGAFYVDESGAWRQ